MKKNLKSLNEIMTPFITSLIVEGYSEQDIATWMLDKANSILEPEMLNTMVEDYIAKIECRLDDILNV